MGLNFWLTQLFNGVSYGALLFLLGAGLSLIFGVMRIVNLSHGAYFLLGGYVALSVMKLTGSWLLAIPVAGLAIGLLGVVTERLFFRSTGYESVRTGIISLSIGVLLALALSRFVPALAGWVYILIAGVVLAAPVFLLLSRVPVVAIEGDTLRQVLLTVGFAFLFQQAALDIWGGENMDIVPPAVLKESIQVAGVYLPLYRVFMIAIAAFIGLVLWLAMEKTRMGAMVRATVDDAQMARGVGIDTSRISMFIFGLGAFLAALGGVIGGGFLGIYPGLDFQILPLAFAVVIIGGMGSLGGAAVGALVVGLADNLGKALFPEISYFTLYAPMALILAWKPTGLFGRE